MPTVNPSYPGVYISETASIPHGVTPATTNLLAVLGDFPMGSTTDAVPVTSWPQFEALYGKLTPTSSLAAYAVWQFFLNGGIAAWIVRLNGPVPATPVQPPATTDLVASSLTPNPTGATTATAVVPISPTASPALALTISAANPGAWAKGYTVAFAPSGPIPQDPVTHVDFRVSPRTLPGSPPTPPAPLETIPNIALLQGDGTPISAGHLAGIINNASSQVHAEPAPPPPAVTSSQTVAPPPALLTTLSGGSDAVWDDASFMNACVAELQPGARLDRIAPQVFNLLCVPDLPLYSTGTQNDVFTAAHLFCERRQAFFLLDPPPPTGTVPAPEEPPVDAVGAFDRKGYTALLQWANGFLSPDNTAAATYYPWVQITDPATGLPRFVPPSGTMAGVYATTDVTRGVWKAPAGTEAGLHGVTALADPTINDAVNGDLNIVGVNCLRTFPLAGQVAWGSRTLAGSDLSDSPFKYVPVRRLSDFIEQSLQQSLRWAVFEPNGPALWSSIRLEVTGFMAGLFAQGAFAGASATQAYQVACDATTTTPADMLRGIVNVNVQFAPVDPAEFVMLNVTITAAAPAS